MNTADATPLPFLLSPRVIAALRQRFQRVVVFSGAGMSKESGIATFRSGDNALWRDFLPEELATLKAWRRDRARVWGWYEWRRAQVMRAQPNAGHVAVAELQQRLRATVVTQNVDDLHERAGAQGVLHLHGSLFTPRCDTCGLAHDCPAGPLEEGDAPRDLEPPPCSNCIGRLRPGVVWFGESLPQDIVQATSEAVSACDLLLIVGTSGTVQPAAGLVHLAPYQALVLNINPVDTAWQGQQRLHVAGTAAQALPLIRDLLC